MQPDTQQRAAVEAARPAMELDPHHRHLVLALVCTPLRLPPIAAAAAARWAWCFPRSPRRCPGPASPHRPPPVPAPP